MKKFFALLLAGMIGVACTTAPMGCSKETPKTPAADKDKGATTTPAPPADKDKK